MGAPPHRRRVAGGARTHALDLRAEQLLEVSLDRGSSTQAFTLVAPGGTPLHTDRTSAQGSTTVTLPATGTHRLDARSVPPPAARWACQHRAGAPPSSS